MKREYKFTKEQILKLNKIANDITNPNCNVIAMQSMMVWTWKEIAYCNSCSWSSIEAYTADTFMACPLN